MNAVHFAGRRYGMELHFQKFQVLPVQTDAAVVSPAGERLPHSDYMNYLGATLAADGDMDRELNGKLAAAKRDFFAVRKVWSHSSLTQPGKLRVYASLIESKLLYGLSGACLNKNQVRRLDSFQNRCLRYILGIKPSFLSRVSNAAVLSRAQHPSASTLLLERQLHLFGKVLRTGPSHPMRLASFAPETTTPATDRFVRRKGRPCKEYIPDMISHVKRFFGNLETAVALAQNKRSWKQAVREKTRQQRDVFSSSSILCMYL